MPPATPCPGPAARSANGSRLLSSRAARLGHDRCHHIDELRKARGFHPVGVLQQADEQAPDDRHRIGHRVLVLEELGAYGHVFTSVIFPLSLKRSEYQTFHSSNEMLMVRSLCSAAFTESAVVITVSTNASMSAARGEEAPPVGV